ncbi:SapB/AmfS family lanthipeptide [Streptomyces triculaminicus]|uniref:SapB/AmfS family lanthipeptide n=1 Tax=Streptomyces triculaminicus TaxID=2816232 RepID=UPI0037CDFE2E
MILLDLQVMDVAHRAYDARGEGLDASTGPNSDLSVGTCDEASNLSVLLCH